jgi:Flp pilus assembly protein TadG
MLRRLHQSFHIGLRARNGTAAVEFALIAPILIVIYWGLADLSLGIMANRKTAHLAATMGDLVAQSESLTQANVNDIFEIGTSILEPFPAGTNLQMRISSVTRNKTTGVIAADWTPAPNKNWKGTTTVDTKGLTTDQLPAGETLIITEVIYDYTPPIGKFLPLQSTFKSTTYHHPRSGAVIPLKP